MYNLRKRHLQCSPYTRSGNILIAVNPYQWIPDLYSIETSRKYSSQDILDPQCDTRRKDLDPHVFEVSALSYRALMGSGHDQTIIISGESGAGKTETVKICLRHIANLQREEVTSHLVPVVERILDSNPLLESFGNARTIRNDNSSRFGKFLKLQFDTDHTLIGSSCEVYLLEKSRVVDLCYQERDFHIFYQLLSAPAEIKVKVWAPLLGKTKKSFPSLWLPYTHDGDTNTEEEEDAARFADTRRSLALLDIQEDTMYELMRALVIVLQFSAITFQSNVDNQGKTDVSSGKEIQELAELLGLNTTRLEEALTLKSLRVGVSEEIKAELTTNQARDGRDAFAKHIYTKVFHWLVHRINACTSAKAYTESINFLDIFGFETFEVNRFEQFCINYANERLQYQFAKDVLRTIHDEYRDEGIDFGFSYDTNSDVLALYENPLGILAILDEECVRPMGNDVSFVRKTVTANIQSPRFATLKVDTQFGIQHFAGTVIYTSDKFVSRNRDRIPGDLKQIGKECSNSIIKELMEEDEVECNTSSLLGSTVISKFRHQLGLLLKKISASHTRYIRCITPNTTKEPLAIDNSLVLRQLRTSGVIAAILISRHTFPNRMEHENLLSSFRCFRPRTCRCESTIAQVKQLLTTALRGFAESRQEEFDDIFVVGKSRTYFRLGVLEFLEGERMTMIGYFAETIQKNIRGYLLRRCINLKHRAARTISTFLKYHFARRVVQQRIDSAERIQGWYRSLNIKYIMGMPGRTIQASIILQRAARKFLQRSRLLLAATTEMERKEIYQRRQKTTNNLTNFSCRLAKKDGWAATANIKPSVSYDKQTELVESATSEAVKSRRPVSIGRDRFEPSESFIFKRKGAQISQTDSPVNERETLNSYRPVCHEFPLFFENSDQQNFVVVSPAQYIARRDQQKYLQEGYEAGHRQNLMLENMIKIQVKRIKLLEECIEQKRWGRRALRKRKERKARMLCQYTMFEIVDAVIRHSDNYLLRKLIFAKLDEYEKFISREGIKFQDIRDD